MSLRRMVRGGVGVLGLAVLAGCNEAVAPLTVAGRPDALSFNIGGYGVGSTALELRRDTVVLWRTPWDWEPGTAVDTVRTVPTGEQWRSFWGEVERAGVHNWRAWYVAEGVADGTGWAVGIAAQGRRLESAGSNAYPEQDGREREMEQTEAFGILRAALSALVGTEL